MQPLISLFTFAGGRSLRRPAPPLIVLYRCATAHLCCEQTALRLLQVPRRPSALLGVRGRAAGGRAATPGRQSQADLVAHFKETKAKALISNHLVSQGSQHWHDRMTVPRVSHQKGERPRAESKQRPLYGAGPKRPSRELRFIYLDRAINQRLTLSDAAVTICGT